jgi:hypothetical protein
VFSDLQNTELYTLLWEICGKPPFYSWGEHAFHGDPGYEASWSQKEQAVIAFKKNLKKL